MKRQVINWLKRVIESYRYKRIFRSTKCEYRDLLNKSGYENKPAQGESDYVNLWKQLTNRVEVYSYRLFSHYIGNISTIVPDYIGRRIIAYYLDPPRYSDFYEDKNSYNIYHPMQDKLPKTYFFRINGGGI